MTNNAGSKHFVASSSVEDYLEAILELSLKSGGETGITELSDHLGVSKPSVTAAMKRLSAQGLVDRQRYGPIQLTAEGKKRAADVARRHRLLVRLLRDVLGIDGEIAESDACRIEHVLSHETTVKLAAFVEFLAGGDIEGSGWNRDFESFVSAGKHHAELIREYRKE